MTPVGASMDTVNMSQDNFSSNSPSAAAPQTIKVEEDENLSGMSDETHDASPDFPSQASILRDAYNDEATVIFDLQTPIPVSGLNFLISYCKCMLRSLMIDLLI